MVDVVENSKYSYNAQKVLRDCCNRQSLKTFMQQLCQQVMVDSDVAMLYHYPTKRINETVRRNIERFPESFCFQLTEMDVKNMRSQIATASNVLDNKFRNKKYLPYVFTEQGIAMPIYLIYQQKWKINF